MHRLTGIIALATIGWSSAFGSEPFLTSAAQGGIAAVEAARLAAKVTQNSAVEEHAYGLIYDHEHMNEQLARIAAKRGITLPSAPEAARAAGLQALRDAPPSAFDAMYLAFIADEHERLVELLQSSLLHADTEVAVFASYNLPRERAHGRMARELKSSLSAAK